MSGLDVSRLSPDDCVAALSSYPRRFRAAMEPATDDEEPQKLARRAGPDGYDAIDLADAAAAAVARHGAAVHHVLTAASPTVAAEVLDAADLAVQRSTKSVEAVLDSVAVECQALADAAQHVDSASWGRTAKVVGSGHTVSALDVLRAAVLAGATGLRATETAMQAARR